MKRRDRSREVLRRLKKTYAVRGPFVAWQNPLELVIATVLSAQCTDKRVNQVTKKLFKKSTKNTSTSKTIVMKKLSKKLVKSLTLKKSVKKSVKKTSISPK